MATDAASATRLTPTAENRTDTYPNRIPGEAEVRITRQFAIFVGAGYLAYLLLSLGNITRSTDYMASWWVVGAPTLVFGSGLAVGIVAAFDKRRLIRPAIAAAVLAYLLAVLLTPVAWKHGFYGDEAGLWYSQFPGLVGVAIGLGWPRRAALAYLAVLTSTGCLMCRIVKPPELNIPVGPDLAFAFAYSVPFVVAVAIGVRTSRILDDTRAQTFDVARRTAAARARADERRRFDALTHDGIMTVLLGAARLGATDSIARLAARTIAELGDSRDASHVIAVAEAIAQIQNTVTEIDDAVSFTVTDAEADADADSGDTLEQEVVRTMAAAMAEALRNSLRHAGDDATVGVRVTVGRRSLEIEIADRGAGFDLTSVPPHRLGIAVSIRGRMSQVDGGRSHIESRPGAGTRVVLTWNAAP